MYRYYYYTVAATTSKKTYGVLQAHRSARQHLQQNVKEQEKLNGTSVPETVPGSYCFRILQ